MKKLLADPDDDQIITPWGDETNRTMYGTKLSSFKVTKPVSKPKLPFKPYKASLDIKKMIKNRREAVESRLK